MLADLPVEILMQIFTHCCTSYQLHQSSALVLSQVCQLWRSLALSMSSLWASFALKVPQPVPNQFMLELLHLHLSRSGNHQLSLDVDIGKDKFGLTLFALLVEHSDRWIRVRIPVSDFTLPVLSHLKGRLSCLESLHLRLAGTVGYRSGDQTFFMDAPRLQKLALASSLPFNFPFPNSQLCELHLGAAATLDMFQFMEQCSWPCLTTLILNPFYPLKFRGASAHIPLTRLKTLVLAIRDGYSRNPIIDVLDILATPALENLEVWGLREILIPRQSFASFIERSDCTVTSLRLTFKDNVPVPNLLSNFRTLAMLSHLAIFALGSDAMNPMAKVLSALISSADAESLLPHLVNLELQTTSFLPVLLDMVESRLASRANCTRLERLACHNVPPPTEYRRLTAAQGVTILWPPRHRPAKSHVFIQ